MESHSIQFVNNSSIPYNSESKLDRNFRFWYVEEKIVKEETQTKYVFDYVGLYSFLMNYQIGRFKRDDEDVIFVHAHDHIVKQVKPEDVKDFVLSAAEQEDDPLLMQMLYRGSTNYLAEAKLANLKFIELRFLQALAKTHYIHFENCSVEIDMKGIRTVDFAKLKGFIWQSEMLKFKLALAEKPLLRVFKDEMGVLRLDRSCLEQARKSDFYKYLAYTSYYNHRENEEYQHSHDPKMQAQYQEIEHFEDNEQGIIAKLTAFGYLLHTYKDSSCTKAIICMDSKMSEVGQSFGRSGKSLFGRAVGKFLKYYYIDGRDPNFGKENHTYDGFTKDMKLVFVDDADQNLNFGMFFTMITGEFTVNTKNIVKMKIPFEESPKLLITTNHAIRGEDPSTLARQFLIGFSDYFSEERTPIDALGKRLFDDWTMAEWTHFYNICFAALQIYLEHGLVEASIDSLKKRRLRQSIGENFISWAEIYFDETNINQEIEKLTAYQNFENLFPTYVKKYCTIRQFKQKLKDYANLVAWVYNKNIPDTKEGKAHGGDIKKNGKEYFKYTTPEENTQKPDEVPF
jgi:DNA primase